MVTYCIETAVLEATRPIGAKAVAVANKENIKEFYGAEWKEDPYSVAKNSDCLIILTEWNEFKELDLKKIKDIMAKPIIIDFRNLFSLGDMQGLNFEYHSVGRHTIRTK